jgi:hypothetical protein
MEKYSLLLQIGMTTMTKSLEERPLQTKDRLQHAVHRSMVIRRVQNDPRLADAPSALETHRKCNVFKPQREKLSAIYNLRAKAERLEPNPKIVAMYGHRTNTSRPTYNRALSSFAYSLIRIKKERSLNPRSESQRTRQIRGLLTPRKSRKYLQVARWYLQVPTGTYFKVPVDQVFKPRISRSTKHKGAAHICAH